MRQLLFVNLFKLLAPGGQIFNDTLRFLLLTLHHALEMLYQFLLFTLKSRL